MTEMQGDERAVGFMGDITPEDLVEMVQHASDGPWVASWTECRMCGQKWVSVFPVQADDTCLQCPNCEHMTGEADDSWRDKE